LKNELFKTVSKRPEYYQLNIENEEIKNTIFQHPEFTTFGKKMDAVYNKWETATTTRTKALDKGLKPKQEIHAISENLLKHYTDRQLTDKYAMYQHLMDYWFETMQDDFYELAADGWNAGNEVKRIEKKTKKGGKEVVKQVAGLEGLEGRLIPPALIIQEYYAIEQKAIDDLEAELERTSSEKDELSEENGTEDQALHGVSNKSDVNKAIAEYNLLVWEEYFADTYKSYSTKSSTLIQLGSSLSKKLAHGLFDSVRNAKGKITQKAVNDRLKSITDTNEKKALKEYIELIKKIGAIKKEMGKLYDAAIIKVNEKMETEPDAEYLLELSILNKFLSLLENEAKLKAEIKALYDELEILIIKKYPMLSIDEIKTIVVEKKWMHSMEQLIRIEMDNISHRLTKRIKELAERYETALPKLSSEVDGLTAKVEKHLKQMKFIW
jgi:type I restriction enzyme M protein